MDRSSRIGLFLCLGLLLALQFTLDKVYPPPKIKPKPAVAVTTLPPSSAPNAVMSGATSSPSGTTAPAAPSPSEKLTVLENDAMKVTFTSLGASIKDVELKLQKADDGGNIILNDDAQSNIMALDGWPGVDPAGFDSQTNLGNGITYTCTLSNGVQWQRTYAFGRDPEKDAGMSGYLRVLFHKIARKLGQPEAKPEVYTLDISDKLTNPGAADVTLPVYSLGVGRAQPLYDPITQWSKRQPAGSNSLYLGSGWLTKKLHLTTLNDFNSSSYFWIFPGRSARTHFLSTEQDDGTLQWLGVENQFFAVLLTPETENTIQHAGFYCLNPRDANGNIVPSLDPNGNALPIVPDIEAVAYFPAFTVPAGKSVTMNYGLYTGPKDFNRLDALGQDQGALMNYDGFLPFSWLIVPMLTVLKFWYLIFHNYGVAIILLTLMIKAITWPLQSFANRSGKRMQALAPKLKELQAKFKETPEKLQTETFAMYREYGVNPFGGCLPALVQMPVFFSLYFMLQNAVELRGQSFLWVHDLTKPDSLWTAPFVIFGFHPSLHPLPIMVTALTMVMMRMTPQIGDPQQAKIAQIMPLFFLFIFYNFAAALSLYYVINNAVSIIQIYRNLKKPMPELKRIQRKKTA
jgi:YidC/Oxa1 family membrane protein insertase